ncbi:MAG TPA: hypothetical protein VII23_20355 [Terriglobales bacterium]
MAITRDEYVRVLNTRRRRSLFLTVAVPFLCFGVAWGLLYLVKSGPEVGISKAGSDYLLNTGPKQFSGHELERILERSQGGLFGATALVIIYWIYFVCILVTATAFLIAPFRILWRRNIRRRDWRDDLLTVTRLQHALAGFIESPSISSKTRLRLLAVSPGLYTAISPLRARWFRRPEYQWFKPQALDPDTRSIVHTAQQMETALWRAVGGGRDLRPFLHAIDVLSNFFFAIACRQDKRLRQYCTGSREPDDERSLLIEFARIARPAVLDARKTDRRERRPSRVFALVSAVWSSTVTRVALAVSSSAAGVMLFGVLLFHIQRSQAFLTWFTVSFGSVTLSIGVEAFKLGRPAAAKGRDSVRDE